MVRLGEGYWKLGVGGKDRMLLLLVGKLKWVLEGKLWLMSGVGGKVI